MQKSVRSPLAEAADKLLWCTLKLANITSKKPVKYRSRAFLITLNHWIVSIFS
jgi:hypothetical protein